MKIVYERKESFHHRLYNQIVGERKVDLNTWRCLLLKNINIKQITTSDIPLIDGYESFVQIDGNRIMGNGILLDRKGKVLWKEAWEHSYFHTIYLKKWDVVITDRFAMPGPWTVSLGICCISMKTGKYVWKHWYENSSYERRAIWVKEKPNINLVRGIGNIDSNCNYILTDGFKIKIEDGSYKYIGKDDFIESALPGEVTSLREIKSYIPHWYEKNKPIKFGIDSVSIGSNTLKRDGYFFNKCSAIIPKDNSLYFFAIPAKRNPHGVMLLKYSLEKEIIEEEYELPFRTGPHGVCDYFNNGILIYEIKRGKKNSYNLWLMSFDG
jgi:hypothetical protein